jgi:hypothetical protein
MPGIPRPPRKVEGGAKDGSILLKSLAATVASVWTPVRPITISPTLKRSEAVAVTSPTPIARMTSPMPTGGI